MKIAVTYDNGQIFQHFGHSEYFKMYETTGSTVQSTEVVSTNGSGHGAIAKFLKDNNVEVLVCGGIGGGAKTALAEAGIKLFGGVSGSADEAVNALIENKLEFNPDVKCTHHDHEHGDEPHTCGDHGCSKGNCTSH
ncbi:MAG: NifB/NifX family molybdenum-iron cluster-binding protein [Oscillospiraceae bacterium]